MKYLVTHILSQEERNMYESMGLYCYDLRDADDGSDIASIEKRVLVNRVGSMITNQEIKLGSTSKDDYVDYEEFTSNNKSVDRICELLNKNKIKNKEER